ncbi:oxygen-independent coproporphyrinogen III oxidase [Devosia sp. WQ 349]|uniref:oxygen-independent coproporphyrinogen III oxidase n=1 Tax=Devosia sp. WQ 349K1 TaxID=2800329 RepID=UPI001905A0C9|nr:oxygen-independent coproporphyrinogen III oxidase [Devosia sp. WQ 349K1]MBK1795441.1 oxygen-independent coproporphyrinogen III oxidase [Devosia sp. WQ 349K1]
MALTTAQLVDRYSAPVPRYTSYPTAPHFHGSITGEIYAQWLKALPEDATLSLYFHIPYCDRLCWFCGCHTKHTLRYEPVADYLLALYAEMDWVSRQLEGRGIVTAIHLGGGSPTLLKPADLLALKRKIADGFTLSPAAEISIEIDPNDLDEGRFDAFAEFGLTRASIGVQDFDITVQKAINRLQSYEQTAAVVQAVRSRGVRSVNLDLVYGLPHQTLSALEKTVAKALLMEPDRCALFGYAHVPWMKPHQKMIDEATLPGRHSRFQQAQRAAEMFTWAGYRPIGFDHFARPGDSLAIAAENGTLKRNFQGYTDDAADALIGFGASAIGQFPQGYVQNIVATADYKRRVHEGKPATGKGVALTQEDRLHRHAIERLLCAFALRPEDFHEFGRAGANLFESAVLMAESDSDGLLTLSGNSVVVTDTGRPFVRAIAARFDQYLTLGTARHSLSV